MSPDQTGGVKVGHAMLALDLPETALGVIKKVLDALFVQEECRRRGLCAARPSTRVP